ncbi:integrase [Pseudomonas monteilii]|uniref:integrase n=2 Tax=Pseudomonas TaxID=286 RepID=UPI0012D719C1|nr:integrase [Pseudomonas monteilii]
MQRLLKRFNFIDEYKPLFATPSTLGYRGLIQWDEGWNRNIDIMSDYFQTPFDKNGHRYYIRQHQLRRFFALMFFHTYGTGGLNAIRWMLGHRDIEHVYRYIRSIVDAPSLRGALTQFALEDMAKGRLENYEVLADLLESKFGTATYGLYDEVEADIYIQSRVKNGDVIIEPVFFTDENGQQMQVIVRATNKGH